VFFMVITGILMEVGMCWISNSIVLKVCMRTTSPLSIIFFTSGAVRFGILFAWTGGAKNKQHETRLIKQIIRYRQNAFIQWSPLVWLELIRNSLMTIVGSAILNLICVRVLCRHLIVNNHCMALLPVVW
jgi:hypothetical protein